MKNTSSENCHSPAPVTDIYEKVNCTQLLINSMPKNSSEGSNQRHVSGSASSNWLALQKQLQKPKRNTEVHEGNPRKRRMEHIPSPSSSPLSQTSYSATTLAVSTSHSKREAVGDIKNSESLSALRKMIFGQVEHTENQQLPGKYLALDCEMVGVGVDGKESSLARVSIVNFYGAVQLDEYVRQRERVVDYRTEFSGIRESDMIKAKPFDVVQKQVAELLKDRILIGHAVHNDLKALLLSHPRPQTRDTQSYAGKFKVVRSKIIALRHLVKQELNVTIQDGEHSSITDARATMAVYRLHRKEWEKGNRQLAKNGEPGKKRKLGALKRSEAHIGDDNEGEEEVKDKFPGDGRKGVSSGLTTVIRRGINFRNQARGSGSSGEKKTKWWKELAGGSKETLRFRKPG